MSARISAFESRWRDSRGLQLSSSVWRDEGNKVSKRFRWDEKITGEYIPVSHPFCRIQQIELFNHHCNSGIQHCQNQFNLQIRNLKNEMTNVSSFLHVGWINKLECNQRLFLLFFWNFHRQQRHVNKKNKHWTEFDLQIKIQEHSSRRGISNQTQLCWSC